MIIHHLLQDALERDTGRGLPQCPGRYASMYLSGSVKSLRKHRRYFTGRVTSLAFSQLQSVKQQYWQSARPHLCILFVKVPRTKREGYLPLKRSPTSSCQKESSFMKSAVECGSHLSPEKLLIRAQTSFGNIPFSTKRNVSVKVVRRTWHLHDGCAFRLMLRVSPLKETYDNPACIAHFPPLLRNSGSSNVGQGFPILPILCHGVAELRDWLF